MFRNNCDEPFETSKNCSVNHHWSRGGLVRSLFVVVGAAILQVETLRQLEVELDRRALEGSFESILDCDINFWAIEGTIAWIKFPFPGVELVQRLLQLLIRE